MMKLKHLIVLLALYSVPVIAQVTLPEERNFNMTELDYVVAEVNEDVILKTELDRFISNIRSQLRDKSTQLPPRHVLEKQALDRLVIQQLQLQMAHRTGIRIDDETLNATLNNIAKKNKMSLDKLRERFERDGVDYSEFREEIRKEIIITQLQQRRVINKIRVSQREIDQLMDRQKVAGKDSNMLRVGHILIALPEASTTDQIQSLKKKAQEVYEKLLDDNDFGLTAIAESNGQKALEGGDLGWLSISQLPTLFADSLLTMQPGQISKILTSPSGFHIIKLLEKKDRGKHMVRQTSARHILIKSSEIVLESDVLTRLNQLKTRIEGGEDFATLARANSEDTISAQNGGDLGWTNPGDLVPQFEQTMNSLEVDEISKPVKTRFGWHIIQVLEHREQDNTKQYLRTKTLEAIRKRKAQEALEIWTRQLRDEAYVKYNLQQ